MEKYLLWASELNGDVYRSADFFSKRFIEQSIVLVLHKKVIIYTIISLFQV